jgi:hypothetical protein
MVHHRFGWSYVISINSYTNRCIVHNPKILMAGALFGKNVRIDPDALCRIAPLVPARSCHTLDQEAAAGLPDAEQGLTSAALAILAHILQNYAHFIAIRYRPVGTHGVMTEPVTDLRGSHMMYQRDSGHESRHQSLEDRRWIDLR